MKKTILLILCAAFLGACASKEVVKENAVVKPKEYVKITCNQYNNDVKNLIMHRLKGHNNVADLKAQVLAKGFSPKLEAFYLKMIDSVYGAEISGTDEEKSNKVIQLYKDNATYCP